MRNQFFPAFTCIFLAGIACQSQAAPLAPLVVTPSRMPQSQASVDAAVTVINRQAIETSGAQSLDELLLGIPGVAISNSGGYGKLTSVFLRGTGSNHTLVMIDGVRINTAKDGAALIQNIPLDQIQRIEVVRGPRSSLYGSDALGGVIQIFTRRTSKAFAASSSATVGNQGTTRFSQFLGGNSNGTRWDLNLGGFSTSGQDATVGGELDRDGFNSRSVSGGFDSQVGDRLTLGARLYRSQGNTQFDNNYAVGSYPNTDYVQQTLSTHADVLVSERMTWKTRLSQSQDRLKNYTGGQPTDTSVGKRNTLSTSVDYILSAKQSLTAGLERSEDHIRSTDTQFAEDSRYNNAVFVESLGSEWGFTHQGSLRFDDNQQFGNKVTGNLVIGYPISPLLSPYVSYGNAFVAPSFVDLYYPGYSNPKLQPEVGNTWELGLKGAAAHWHYSFNVYRSRIRDLIVSLPPNYIPENLNRARIRGAEASFGADWAGWDLTLAAGYTHAVDADSGQQLIRRPRWDGRASVARTWHRFTFRGDVQTQGAVWDQAYIGFTPQRVRLGGYAITNLSATWQARPDLQLEARVNNLFDRNAVTVYGYNGRGRLVLATVRYQYR